jgi:shikimate dehydrogenase
MTAAHDDAPALFAVLGDPIAHSRSPAMHGAAFAAMGLPHVYVARRVDPADLGAALQGARALGFSGLNLTVPHKQAALPHLHAIDEAARRIGAVNTIDLGDGRLVGHNTDAPGFLDALSELPGPEVQRAVVLGGGGAARAIVDALRHAAAPAQVTWISRRPEALPGIEGVVASDWPKLHGACEGADLVVHATTFGMKHGAQALPAEVPWSALAKGARVIDIVVPRPAGGLLDAAEAAGLAVQDGRAMLLWQGARALAIWLRRPIAPPAIAAMRAALAT